MLVSGLWIVGCLSALDERELTDQSNGGTAGTAASAGSAGANDAGSAGTSGSSGRGGNAGSASGGKGGSATGSAGEGDESGGSAGEPGSGGDAGGEATGGTDAAGADGSGGTSGTTGGDAGSAGTNATTGGTAGIGGVGGAGIGGSTGGGGAGIGGSGGFGQPTMTGGGSTTDRFATASVGRNDVPYRFLANGWGTGFASHSIRWEGTSFVVESFSGSLGPGGQPAGYPLIYCGRYTETTVPACGLPAAIASLTTLPTGFRWASNGNTGAYDAAYDIWLGNGTQVESYVMVWLRDPPSHQPYGSHAAQGIVIDGQTFNAWTGSVNGLPVVTYVRAEGQDLAELEFNVLDLIDEARGRGFTLPGTYVNAVAVGFEIFSGPITNLAVVDFYVDALP